jgi:hypothetical protein
MDYTILHDFNCIELEKEMISGGPGNKTSACENRTNRILLGKIIFSR